MGKRNQPAFYAAAQILMTNQPKTDINKLWGTINRRYSLVTHFLLDFFFNRFLPFFNSLLLLKGVFSDRVRRLMFINVVVGP